LKQYGAPIGSKAPFALKHMFEFAGLSDEYKPSKPKKGDYEDDKVFVKYVSSYLKQKG
jgi:hypothetical protein